MSFVSPDDFDKSESDLKRIQARIKSFKTRQTTLIKRAQDQAKAETQRADERETERKKFLEKQPEK